MSNPFANTTLDPNAQQETNTLQAGGYTPLPSDIYQCVIKLAYFTKSASGALALNYTLKTHEGAEVRETIYITAGDAKKNVNFYMGRDGEKIYYPSFMLAESMCKLALGKTIGEVAVEKRTIKLRDYKQNLDVDTDVDMLVELIDQPIAAGIWFHIDDKTTKSGNVVNGKDEYVPTGEFRQSNKVAKFFRSADLMTVPEIIAKADTATFHQVWLDQWRDKVKDVSKGISGATAGAPRAPNAAGGTTTAPPSNLFSSKPTDA